MTPRLRKMHKPEQIVATLRDADVMLNAGKDLTVVLKGFEIGEASVSDSYRKAVGSPGPLFFPAELPGLSLPPPPLGRLSIAARSAAHGRRRRIEVPRLHSPLVPLDAGNGFVKRTLDRLERCAALRTAVERNGAKWSERRRRRG